MEPARLIALLKETMEVTEALYGVSVGRRHHAAAVRCHRFRLRRHVMSTEGGHRV
jgi:hypothetical protein